MRSLLDSYPGSLSDGSFIFALSAVIIAVLRVFRVKDFLVFYEVIILNTSHPERTYLGIPITRPKVAFFELSS
jgi:hypothetical protein